MTKKKPDFLRDLDTAIMDELTGGGIKGNAAELVGTLTQIKEIKQLCGLPFCGYMAKLETVRPSGVPDEVTVVFAEDVPYRACNGIEFDVMQEFVEGSRLYLMSQDYICERCGQPAKIVHHKRWLNRENINDISVTLCWDNLEALCQDCHNKEHHKQERHKRYRFDENGGILPPYQKNN